ncbi:hypothetical protein SAMN05192534_13613 [Alteribacillus persepolensis]|uniref:Uncharacterized protein n=1 Tax=Alteribacillus persepolensis TaxID=568899 RepID=A0A1G8JTA2_9BACI|nr:hypothetical protein [Alteribacillus persepolensis]SDI33820.1 hypothetical protein SAMN05192534_13613 [Alteribacillus persepolensis]
MERKMKHLEMIQSVISRMASNSFMLKRWTTTLVTGLFALANVAKMDAPFMLLAFIPTMMFWFLDAYFIQQERLFRKLYQYTALLKEEEIDFFMDVKPFQSKKSKWLHAIFSKTVCLFYIPILMVIVVLWGIEIYAK